MSAEAQPLGPHPESADPKEIERNGTARRHDLVVGRLESIPPVPPVSKANGHELSPSPLADAPPIVEREPSFYERVVKPVFDRIAAALFLLLTLPLMVALALGIRLRLGPGVLFRQQRVGIGGAEFTIYKFRTMAPDRRGRADDGTGLYDGSDRRRTHKTDLDPRHTGFGRFLRKFSLDELPQLLNVLIGDMSLVGPRPELVGVALSTGIVDHPRHWVRPGLTGLWQVSPARSRLIVDGLDLDIEYVASCGFLTDLKILVLTVPAVWRRTGS